MSLSLNYSYIQGDASQTFVFLHGFMGDIADWEAVCRYQKGQMDCLLIDLPGHGGSRLSGSRAYTMEGASQLIIQILQQLQIQRAVLLGYSMGGRLAMYMGIRFPHMFERIIIESATPGLRDVKQRHKRRRKDRSLADRLETENYQNFLDRWYKSRIFASSTFSEEKLQMIKQRRLKNAPYGHYLAKSLRFMGQGMQISLWDDLPDVSIPFDFIVGERDENYVRIAKEAKSASSLINAHMIKGVGHNTHEEDPQVFCRLLNSFVLERV